MRETFRIKKECRDIYQGRRSVTGNVVERWVHPGDSHYEYVTLDHVSGDSAKVRWNIRIVDTY